MLKLRNDWNAVTTETVVTDLLDQSGTRPLQIEFARTIIADSLELMLKAIAIRRPHRLQIEVVGNLGWQIRDAVYTYQPVIDNKSVNACTDLAMSTLMLSVIVPPGHEVAMRRCLDLGGRTPNVDTLPGFISHRVLFASLDADWTHDETLLYLLAQYNKRIANAKTDNSLLVVIPEKNSPAAAIP
jgi:hypothetical protein